MILDITLGNLLEIGSLVAAASGAAYRIGRREREIQARLAAQDQQLEWQSRALELIAETAHARSTLPPRRPLTTLTDYDPWAEIGAPPSERNE